MNYKICASVLRAAKSLLTSKQTRQTVWGRPGSPSDRTELPHHNCIAPGCSPGRLQSGQPAAVRAALACAGVRAQRRRRHSRLQVRWIHGRPAGNAHSHARAGFIAPEFQGMAAAPPGACDVVSGRSRLSPGRRSRNQTETAKDFRQKNWRQKNGDKIMETKSVQDQNPTFDRNKRKHSHFSVSNFSV